jgi:hypothetical protein
LIKQQVLLPHPAAALSSARASNLAIGAARFSKKRSLV